MSLVPSKWWVTTLNGEVIDMKPLDEQDEVLYCTGTPTEHQINELKKRIANGTTTADDVVLLEGIINAQAKPRCAKHSPCVQR